MTLLATMMTKLNMLRRGRKQFYKFQNLERFGNAGNKNELRHRWSTAILKSCLYSFHFYCFPNWSGRLALDTLISPCLRRIQESKMWSMSILTTLGWSSSKVWHSRQLSGLAWEAKDAQSERITQSRRTKGKHCSSEGDFVGAWCFSGVCGTSNSFVVFRISSKFTVRFLVVSSCVELSCFSRLFFAFFNFLGVFSHLSSSGVNFSPSFNILSYPIKSTGAASSFSQGISGPSSAAASIPFILILLFFTSSRGDTIQRGIFRLGNSWTCKYKCGLKYIFILYIFIYIYNIYLYFIHLYIYIIYI